MHNKFIELKTLDQRLATLRKYSGFARSAPTTATAQAHTQSEPLGRRQSEWLCDGHERGHRPAVNSDATTRVEKRGAAGTNCRWGSRQAAAATPICRRVVGVSQLTHSAPFRKRWRRRGHRQKRRPGSRTVRGRGGCKDAALGDGRCWTARGAVRVDERGGARSLYAWVARRAEQAAY
jgi:hypothetical protein